MLDQITTIGEKMMIKRTIVRSQGICLHTHT